MKNPFVAMAALAALMESAFRENILRERFGEGVNQIPGRTRTRIPGRRNPAGAKIIRRFYRAKHGVKASYPEALAWYRGLQ